MELFARAAEEFKRKKAPLADRMRPRNIEEFVGQEHLCLLYTSPSPRD